MSRFDDLAEKIDHLEKPVAMALIFEWTKTGHINKAEFNGLIGRLHQSAPPRSSPPALTSRFT